MKAKVSAPFIIGFISFFVFMSGGFFTVLIASRYQLMFPFAVFIVSPAPFGFGFAIVVNALFDAFRRKDRLVIVVLTIFALLIVATYLFFLNWLAYNGVFKTI
jgi:hypothetical protein